MEDSQIILKEFNIRELTKNLKVAIFKSLSNKIGKPLNIVEIKNDLSKILNIIKGEGYFLLRLKNLDLKNLIQYQNNYKEAIINLNVDIGRIAVFDRALITGNRKTKKDVI